MADQSPTTDDIPDRLELLLDLAIEAMRKGDDAAAMLFIKEAHATALNLRHMTSRGPVSPKDLKNAT
jgi:hypothetical protein